MEAYLLDWANLLLRWLHVIAGVAWIGASFYFVWLDLNLQPVKDEAMKAKGVMGELWAVHGGGFYNPQKYLNAPAALPEHLHWFKWEAYVTWMAGFALLCVQYYGHADLYLIDKSVLEMSSVVAVTIGLVALVAGWIIYDLLCRSPVGDNDRAMLVIMFVFFGAAAWGLSHAFGGRGVYIHIGAMIGTIMVANVLMVIVPGQKKAIASMLAGQVPDPIHGKRGKQRSVHNNYFTLPVLFIMVSNHYPMTFGNAHGWAVLGALSVAGVMIRHFFNLKNTGRIVPGYLVAAAIVLVALIFAIAPDMSASKKAGATGVPYAKVKAVIDNRCIACHSAHPTQAGFNEAPKGVMFDSAEQVKARAALIYQQAVVAKAMPLGNLTQMTDDERALLGAWYLQGAKTE
ncbi:MAG TPA: urate hydroxylase PuuD [Burkholderiales bacterium]|nr:urate hydroxylase PuuD [Burkholderiales bacterium]